MLRPFDSDWRPGQIILGQYEVVGPPHWGGMGVVHRVRHRTWDMELAVKSPRPDMLTAEQIDDFAVEAEVWVGLALHPNVVDCVYVRTADGLPRVFAEWVPAGSLADAIASGALFRDGPERTLRRVLDLSIQIAWGIAHAHDSGLVHQDVKPANVMLTEDGTAKVTDFGLARARGSAGMAALGGFTDRYCSPEQAVVDGPGVSRAADVWSWALTVLELFNGEPLCDHGTQASERLASFRTRSRSPHLPGELAALLRSCFAREPEERPNLGDAAAALTQIYADAVGDPYPRVRPGPVELRADGLSNRALSLLDLGRPEEAERLWNQALETDRHAAVVYNAGLHLWRKGTQTDQELVSRLETVSLAQPDDWVPHYLLGLVHRERDDLPKARQALQHALDLGPEAGEASAAFADLPRDERGEVWLSGLARGRTTVAVSGDGGTVIASDEERTVCLWDTDTGERRHRVRLHPGQITAIAVDATGATAAFGHDDGSLAIWRPDSEPEPRSLDGPVVDGPVTAVAFSGDGGTVAVGAASGCVRLVSALTLLPGRKLGPLPAAVDLLALDADGSRAVAVARRGGRQPGTAIRWDTFTGVRVGGIDLHPSQEPPSNRFIARVGGVHIQVPETIHPDRYALSPDGSEMIVVARHGPLVRWATHSEQVHSVETHRIRPACDHHAYAAASGLLATTGQGLPLQFWQPDTGRCLRTETEPGRLIGDFDHMTVSRDGRTLVLAPSSYSDDRIRVVPVPRTAYRAPWHYAEPRGTIALTDAADRLDTAAAEADRLIGAGRHVDALEALRTVRGIGGFAAHPRLLDLWRAAGAGVARSGVLGVWAVMGHDGHGSLGMPPAAAISGDGSRVVTGSADGHLDVWAADTGDREFRFPEWTGLAHDLAITPCGTFAVSSATDGTVSVWDLHARRRLHVFGTDLEPMRVFSLALDGRRVLTGGAAGTLRLWDVRTGECLSTIRGNGTPALDVALDRTVSLAAVATEFATTRHVQVFRMDTERHVYTSEGLLPGELRLEFGSDGRLLFVGGVLKVRAWEVATGEQRYQLDGGSAGRPEFALGADGGLGVTIEYAEGVRVWDQRSGRVLRVLPTGPIRKVAVTADSRFAVTGGWDHVVQIWDLRSGACVCELTEHGGGVELVSLSANGERLLTADMDGRLFVWELDWDFTRSGNGTGEDGWTQRSESRSTD